MADIYDVVVVGGGAAGLSGAIVLGRCRRRVFLCDVGQPRNQASRAVHCLLGHEGTPPTELLARGRRELERYTTVESHTDRVTKITPTGNQFNFCQHDGDLARVACNAANRGPCVCYWHAELGADGKDYRAISVHAPFPEILRSRVP